MPDWMHPAAHEAMFRAFAPSLSAFVARYVGNQTVAEDLVQDLFLAIWADRARLCVAGSIRPYLFAAARNRALNYLKHERLAGRFRAEWMETADPSAPGESDLLTALEVQRALDALPPRRRRIFTLRRIADLSHTQIATRLGISVKTVEVQMGRALKSLRAHPFREDKQDGEPCVRGGVDRARLGARPRARVVAGAAPRYRNRAGDRLAVG